MEINPFPFSKADCFHHRHKCKVCSSFLQSLSQCFLCYGYSLNLRCTGRVSANVTTMVFGRTSV